MKAEALWNRCLDESRERWIDDAPRFHRANFERGIRFGDRPLCNHLRPKFLTQSEYSALVRASESVMRGILQATKRVQDDPALWQAMNFSAMEETLMKPETGLSHPTPCARLDSFMTTTGPRFVELNGECPAGSGYSELLADAFLDHPLTQRFATFTELAKIPTLQPLYQSLIDAWAEWDGSREPTIAIVDYKEVSTHFEFEICREAFEAFGTRTIVCDPRELEFDGDRLSCRGQAIDLVYKRVLMNEFIDKIDEVRPLFQAYEKGRVCIVNPFRAKIAQKKAIFAVLTGDDRNNWLDPQDIAEIDRTIPWTRIVAETKTRYRGELIDLLPFIVERREDFVLKPNDDYGGRGITLGWEVDEATWRQAVDSSKGADYIVQERIHLVAESFPSLERDLADEDLFVDLDPFLFNGRVGGILARLGVGGLCNVTSGGGQVPVMLVPDEEETR